MRFLTLSSYSVQRRKANVFLATGLVRPGTGGPDKKGFALPAVENPGILPLPASGIFVKMVILYLTNPGPLSNI